MRKLNSLASAARSTGPDQMSVDGGTKGQTGGPGSAAERATTSSAESTRATRASYLLGHAPSLSGGYCGALLQLSVASTEKEDGTISISPTFSIFSLLLLTHHPQTLLDRASARSPVTAQPLSSRNDSVYFDPCRCGGRRAPDGGWQPNNRGTRPQLQEAGRESLCLDRKEGSRSRRHPFLLVVPVLRSYEDRYRNYNRLQLQVQICNLRHIDVGRIHDRLYSHSIINHYQSRSDIYRRSATETEA